MISKQTPVDGQKYVHLESLFKQAINDGTLQPGEKLPPLRIAAWNAKCSLGTMSRVYGSLERKGLVNAEIGRGTFVRETASLSAAVILPRPPQTEIKQNNNETGFIDLGMNAIATEWGEDLVRWALRRASDKISTSSLMTYRDGFGDPQQKLAMRPYLPVSLQEVTEERVLITHGAQNGIFTTLNRLTSPGDTICLEPLSYPGISAALTQSGLSSVIVETDDKGICPSSFERLCKEGRLRILVTTATGHNPTCISTPLSRRKEIGSLAKKYDVLIIEDDIYGFLYPKAPPPYAALFPENSIYLTGLAKRISPSLRIGIAIAPPHITMLMAQGITAQTWMVSPILITTAIEIAARTKDLLSSNKSIKTEAFKREKLIKNLLGPSLKNLKSCRSHAWIELPDDFSAELFVKRSSQVGIHILAGTRFANHPGAGRQNIRLSFMAPVGINTLETALVKLNAILSTPSEKTYDFF